MPFNESTVEEASLDWLRELGCAVASGPGLTPGEPAAERQTFGDVILVDRLRAAISQINSQVPADAVDEVVRKVHYRKALVDIISMVKHAADEVHCRRARRASVRATHRKQNVFRRPTSVARPHPAVSDTKPVDRPR